MGNLKTHFEWARRLKLVIPLAVAAFFSRPLFGAAHYQQVKSFGFQDRTGQQPYSTLTLSTNGILYGTTSSGGTANQGTVYQINQDGSGYHVLHHFGVTTSDGATPYADVAIGSDGLLYGATYSGGTNGWGMLFRMALDGTGYSILHTFGSVTNDGRNPFATLTEGSDGAMYGATVNGGSHGGGMIFRMDKGGSGFTNLHSFGTVVADGNMPYSDLIEASDGMIYGTASGGGGHLKGTIFRLGKDGSNFTNLYSFGSASLDGASPPGAICEGSDGRLYSTTYAGGSNNYGTVFGINKDGTSYQIVHSFAGRDGAQPQAGVKQGPDGFFYGTTETGGSNTWGTIFKVQSDGGAYTVIHHITSLLQGINPEATVLINATGTLFVTTSGSGGGSGGTIMNLGSDGSGFNVLWTFSASGGDGTGPTGLAEGLDGALYGTCTGGGAGGGGIAFGLLKDGSNYRLLRSFSQSGTNDQSPRGPLHAGTNQLYYGVCGIGGIYGGGSLYRVGPTGLGYAVVHSFGNGSDGNSPLANPIVGRDANIYGTTYGGGTNGHGTVFSVTEDGNSYSILYHFSGTANEGVQPNAALLQASDGYLYGTTWNQIGSSPLPWGAVFKIDTDGTGYSVLHSFDWANGDAYKVNSALLEGTDGMLYGTSTTGGSNKVGTVFRLSKYGTNYSILYHFGNGATDGQTPSGSVVEGLDGSLYGMTTGGGSNGAGTVFQMNKDASAYRILYHFGGKPGDGLNPSGSLIRGGDGTFYGTTGLGGSMGIGSVFRIWPPQTPNILGVTVTNSVQLSIAGVNGSRYQVLRSSDLTNWVWSPPFTMPGQGFYVYEDVSAPADRAFYRVAWLP
jgi:uncharacterized repeat protein (TIGR03803 family)